MAAPMRLAASVAKPFETVLLHHQALSWSRNMLTRNFSSGRFFSKGSSYRKKLIGISIAATGLTLTSLGVHRWQPFWPSLQAASSARPYIEPSRRVNVESDGSGLKLTLFQFQTCPFCCKVRAVLDYFGISYDVVEVNSVTKKQIKWSEYKKVPILLADGIGPDGFVQLNDSSVIVSILESLRQNPDMTLEKLKEFYVCIESEEKGKKTYDYPNKYFIMFMDREQLPVTMDELKEERQWRQWADEHLVHMLSPNVYRTPSEALQTFRYFSEVGEWEKNFSTPERLMVIYTGASVMYILGKMLKRKYRLKTDVRESLFEALREWIRGVGEHRAFMGGRKPNMADLSVYGILNSIEGCEAFMDAKENTKIGPWYRSMQKLVKAKKGSPPITDADTAALATGM